MRRRHHLPHWEQGGSYYWVTVRCLRTELQPAARRIVVETLKHDHGRRYELVAAVVMPDHTHLILYPLPTAKGRWHSLSQILRLVKGVSAQRISELGGTAGSLWHSENHDRIIRDDEEFARLAEYLVSNPVRRELVATPEDYAYTIWPGDLLDYKPYS